MVLAVVITFAVAPLVNRLTSDTSTVIRLAEDIKQGAQITEAQIESVKVKTDTIPAGTIKNPKEVVGKYAASDLYAGDYFTAARFPVSPIPPMMSLPPSTAQRLQSA